MTSYVKMTASVCLLFCTLLGSAATFAESTIDEISERISSRLPGLVVSSLTATELPGIYEAVSDGRIYYIDESAEYLIDGNLIRLTDRVNLTDSRLGNIHMGLIEEIGEKNMLIFEPEEASNRSITVFTDISCGYCRRLHAEIDTLLEAGIRVRYLMFPRAGLDSQAFKDLESVWCADDPQEAMTNAKAGGQIEAKSCPNPIEEHVVLAQRLGLRGTPLIYTDSGEKIPGYREASVIADMIANSEPLIP